MADIILLDFANMAAPVVIRFGAYQISKKYGLGNIYAKYGAFGRNWTKNLWQTRLVAKWLKYCGIVNIRLLLIFAIWPYVCDSLVAYDNIGLI